MERLRVVCRFRPENKSTVQLNTSEKRISLAGRDYIFDELFDGNSTQEDVYNGSARSVVSDVLGGINVTIMAYGQTAAGKTYTMEGAKDDATKQGIIPRIANDIFDHMNSMPEKIDVKVSYYEIHMDTIRDLLDVTKIDLEIYDDKTCKTSYVKGATEQIVTSHEEILEAFENGKANRKVGVTNRNAYSSRSHSVFVINVQLKETISGRLCLVDLAGSEKFSESVAVGIGLAEANKINQSLTRILRDSLGGNARTTIIICCSPAEVNASFTKLSLDFGERAKKVQANICVNITHTAEEWKRRYEIVDAELARWKAGASKIVEMVSVGVQSDLQGIVEPVALTTSRSTVTGSTSSDGRSETFDEEEPIYECDPNVYKVVKAIKSRKWNGKVEYLLNWEHSWIPAKKVTKDIKDAYNRHSK